MYIYTLQDVMRRGRLVLLQIYSVLGHQVPDSRLLRCSLLEDTFLTFIT